MDATFQVTLTLRDGYAFAVDFGASASPDGAGAFVVDEPPPLGAGSGPNATRVLAAAVGDCLGSSLLFCLRKARVPVHGLRVLVEGSVVRNERGRMRIGGLRVRLSPDVTPEDRERMGRCLELFEDFCIVTESVRQGIDVDVAVEAAPVGAGV